MTWLSRQIKETQVIGSTKTILRIAGLGIALAAGPAAMAAADVTVPPVPADIQVDETHRAYLMTHAVGTQNFVCLAPGLPWTFTGPQATVFDGEGEQVI